MRSRALDDVDVSVDSENPPTAPDLVAERKRLVEGSDHRQLIHEYEDVEEINNAMIEDGREVDVTNLALPDADEQSGQSLPPSEAPKEDVSDVLQDEGVDAPESQEGRNLLHIDVDLLRFYYALRVISPVVDARHVKAWHTVSLSLSASTFYDPLCQKYKTCPRCQHFTHRPELGTRTFASFSNLNRHM
jgi:hypothetical protein